MEAFTTGCLRSAMMAARVMNGMKVSLTPLRCSYLDFSFSRRRTMRVISTLKTVWTCGLVCLDSTMRFAMMARILVMGTSSPGSGADAGAAGGAGFALPADVGVPGLAPETLVGAEE